MAKKFLIEFHYTDEDDTVTAQEVRETIADMMKGKEEIPGAHLELGEVWDI